MLAKLTASGVLAAAVLPVLAPAAVAEDPPIVVTPGDQTGRQQAPSVGVGVTSAGTGGRGGQGPAAGGGGGPACSWTAAPEMEVWLRRLPSRLPAGGRGTVPAGARLFVRVCGGVESGFAWFGPAAPAAAAPSPGELAQRAYGLLRLPAPVPGWAPRLRLAGGQAAMLVGAQTWLWSAQAVFAPRSRLVRAGAVWARVTAVPVGMAVDPGSGDPVRRCGGPGTPYPPGMYGRGAASPTCGLVLTRSSARFPGGVVTARWVIHWRVSWVGAAGARPASGVLPELASQASVVLAIAEAQALITG